jgi:hypothetical protein
MKKADFETMVDKAFWGLEAKSGFKKTETSFVKRTCTIKFANPTTVITLNYELGNEPWVEIADASNVANKSTLGWLLVELGVEDPPTTEQAFRPTMLSADALEPFIINLGKQLQVHGEKLLQGDFSILPVLQSRAQKYDKDCQRYLSIQKS